MRDFFSSEPNQDLPTGIYEELVTEQLDSALNTSAESNRQEIKDADESAKKLTTHITGRIFRHLSSLRPENQLEVSNSILGLIHLGDLILDPAEQLLSVRRTISDPESMINSRPQTPLTELALLTNSKGEPGIGQELRAELQSADAVDILVAFIKKSGLNNLREQFKLLRDRGIPIRLVTTTYTGASDALAIHEMAAELGVKVKIDFDSGVNRLHAKAWLIHRKSGYTTGFVGSSNLSGAALGQGSEWNVRISQIASPDIVRKFQAQFESYWASSTYKTYDPNEDLEKLRIALASAKFGGANYQLGSTTISNIDVEPRLHQSRMLEDIQLQRDVFDRHRNLVVAATGTGKTVLAALDYKRVATELKRNPRLLFIAHRKEILKQALDTFRQVLKDPNFGELHVDGLVPQDHLHVFASIQSLAQLDVPKFTPEHYEFVIFDEFHHGAAKTYRQLFDYVKPIELLALTATPERADGIAIQNEFFDGVITSELRLWDALEEEILCPFQYFGISDDTDLTQVSWSKGKYNAQELSQVIGANEVRNHLIFNEFLKYSTDANTVRGLGFCVSQSHAKHMSDFFNSKGLKSVALDSNTPSDQRSEAIEDLKNGKIRFIFCVDLFNEGVDLPSVDTILMLRPTESPTLFLQQLGRGLRKFAGKEHLLVLDFIGAHRVEYRFEAKYAALTGFHRNDLKNNIENDFPYLPSGCSLILDKKSKEIVLENIKNQIAPNKAKLSSEVRAIGTDVLKNYLEESNRSLQDIYKGNGSWVELLIQAGLSKHESETLKTDLIRRAKSFRCAIDEVRNSHYIDLIDGALPSWKEQNFSQRTLTSMFFWNLFPSAKGLNTTEFTNYDEAIDYIVSDKLLAKEISNVLNYVRSGQDFISKSLKGGLAKTPLVSHATYTRAELLAALGYARLAANPLWDSGAETRKATGHITGVHFSPELKVDLFLVNIHKSEGQFSPTTMYKDFPLSISQFHWETQNSDGPQSTAGKRYINHEVDGSQILLACRQKPKDEFGDGAPFLLLGTARTISHQGEKPMQVTLELDREMPLDFYSQSKVVTAA
ncbi:MAG: DUF3427 domain-containing protein [Actinobacteria bacterium]|uniref:Unannotated protein n=1 Tax=freshwater metagenome TaxID=449393 RepID=A0A6J5ZPZ9_9ZZZZ|nr:DUF3427 domain-containing protein [Actinomycetota bacterium]